MTKFESDGPADETEIEKVNSIGQKDAQIAQIVAGGPGDDRVANRVEKRMGMKTRQSLADDLLAAPARHRAAIGNGSCCGTIAVDAVSARAEDRYIFSGDSLGAGESKLLISTADASIADRDRHFTA